MNDLIKRLKESLQYSEMAGCDRGLTVVDVRHEDMRDLLNAVDRFQDALVELRDKTSCTQGQYAIIDEALASAPAAVPGPLEGEQLKAIYLAAVRFVGHAKRVKFADGKEITGMTDLDNAMKAYEAHYAMARTAAPASEEKG